MLCIINSHTCMWVFTHTESCLSACGRLKQSLVQQSIKALFFAFKVITSIRNNFQWTNRTVVILNCYLRQNSLRDAQWISSGLLDLHQNNPELETHEVLYNIWGSTCFWYNEGLHAHWIQIFHSVHCYCNKNRIGFPIGHQLSARAI